MELEHKIQQLLATPDYHPLRRTELARALSLNNDERTAFRRVLADLVRQGTIVRVRKNRYVLPQDADLVSGRLEFNEKGFAFLVPDRLTEEPAGPDIYVGEEDTGVAMHGDRVVVRLNLGRRRGRRGHTEDKPSGRVVRILERARETVVGTLQRTKLFYYVVPDDTRLVHDIYTRRKKEARVGDKVVVRLADWQNRHVNPEGEIVEVLGPSDRPGVDIIAIIRKHGLATAFPDDVRDQAHAIPDRIPEADLAARRDLRDQFILTIDPDDARDFDDAVQVERLAKGGWRLGVHIADVSHYVPPDTPLDHEARRRGNSTYLVDRVLPMLPEALSNNLCSLRPREDRLVQSCFLEFDRDLNLTNTAFDLSVIHSRHRLTYQEAFARLSAKKDGQADELTNALHTMWDLASRLRADRFRHGALDLDFPETKVRLDDKGQPVAIEKVEYDISHQLIEEFMLVANEAAAREVSGQQVPCLYRIHEDPDEDKLADFRVYAQGFGYPVGDVRHRGELQKLLAKVAGTPEQYAIQLALLRSLKQARYAPRPVGHYGLAKKFYLHFTSPIRRYADLVVHRTLRRLIEQRNPARAGTSAAASPPYPLARLTDLAEHISRTERVSDEAEKESVQLKKLEWFHQQLISGQLDAMDAVVCGVRNFGVFVELPDTLVQGLVHISTLEDDFYRYEEQHERLVGRRTGRVIHVGQKLTVQVEKVDPFKRQIDFIVVPDAKPAPAPPRPKKTRAKTTRPQTKKTPRGRRQRTQR